MQNGYDLIVVGGGLAGVSCALRAAQAGRRVLLVERRPALGWESTWAGQLDFSGAHSPVAKRIVDEIDRVGGLRGNTADGPIIEIALDRLLREAGVSVLLYSYPVRLIYEDAYAFGVLFASRCGEQISDNNDIFTGGAEYQFENSNPRGDQTGSYLYAPSFAQESEGCEKVALLPQMVR